MAQLSDYTQPTAEEDIKINVGLTKCKIYYKNRTIQHDQV